MNAIVNQHYKKSCYKYVCWDCLNTWISDTLSGHGVRCPTCNSGDLSIRPMNGVFKELE